MKAVIWSGGGWAGACQQYLAEKLPLGDFEAGTSIGSVMSRCRVENKTTVSRGYWEALDDRNPADGIKGFASLSLKGGVFNLAPLKEKLAKELKLKDAVTQWGCGVVERNEGKYRILRDHELRNDAELHSAIIGSCAISGLMKAEECRFGTLVDGGHEHVIPVVEEYDEVVAIFCRPIDEPIRCDGDSLTDAMSWAVAMQMRQTQKRDLDWLRYLTKSGVRVTVYAPRDAYGGMLKSDRATIDKRLLEGEWMYRNPVRL